MEKLKSIEEIKKEVEEAEASNNLPAEKSIDDFSVTDIKMTLDTKKSYEDQAADVVGAMATARAVQDEKVAQELSDRKADELKARASQKAKKAAAEEINAETDKQEAERKLYEAVLETFGIKKHLPKWLMHIMVMIFTPVYVVLSLFIGVPCGCVKTIIDNIDNIICRYESADQTSKPKIKVTIIILFVVIILAAAALITLACLNKI